MPQYGDLATAVVMSIGLGVAAILSMDFAPGGNSFESYLFGSISSATDMDVKIVSVVFVLVTLIFVSQYSGLTLLSTDVNMARLCGVNVKLVNGIFTLLAAITIALATKIVGALLVASLIVLPVATSLLISRSYKMMCVFAVMMGVAYTMIGITLSYHFDVKPGGAIVLCAILGLFVCSVYLLIRKKMKNVASN